jgi:hypothetical protein
MKKMSQTAELTTELDFVEADLSYVVDDGQPSVRYIDWPEEAHNAHVPTYELRRVRIVNGRTAVARYVARRSSKDGDRTEPAAVARYVARRSSKDGDRTEPAVGERFTLPTHGFTLVRHDTAVRDFYDEAEVLRVYYPEVERLIEAQTGAKRVVVFDHTIRTADDGRHAERWIRQTVKSVHNDYTERSAPKRVRDILPDEADALLQRRYGIVQVWRSIAPRVESQPLALCDGRSIPEVGFIRNERRYRDRTAETYHISYNPAHRWFYFPYMTRNEALVFKVFDSDASAGVRYTAHTSFDDPTTRPDAKIRESIEMRAFAFY